MTCLPHSPLWLSPLSFLSCLPLFHTFLFAILPSACLDLPSYHPHPTHSTSLHTPHCTCTHTTAALHMPTLSPSPLAMGREGGAAGGKRACYAYLLQTTTCWQQPRTLQRLLSWLHIFLSSLHTPCHLAYLHLLSSVIHNAAARHGGRHLPVFYAHFGTHPGICLWPPHLRQNMAWHAAGGRTPRVALLDNLSHVYNFTLSPRSAATFALSRRPLLAQATA